MTHSPEHFLEKPTLLGAFLSVLLFWAIFWALVWAVELVWALFWALKRVHLYSRALFWVDLLSRVLFWALFRGLSVHQNLNVIMLLNILFQTWRCCFSINYYAYVDVHPKVDVNTESDLCIDAKNPRKLYPYKIFCQSLTHTRLKCYNTSKQVRSFNLRKWLL